MNITIRFPSHVSRWGEKREISGFVIGSFFLGSVGSEAHMLMWGK